MRHNVYGQHLGRDKNERTTLFKGLVGSLILHGSIETTQSRAKAIKGLIDKIISQGKHKNTQRLLQTFLVRKEIREKLIKEVVPSLEKRTSGYTSVVKLGQRQGDGAMMVRMSLLINDEGGSSTSLRAGVKSEKSVEKSERGVTARRGSRRTGAGSVATEDAGPTPQAGRETEPARFAGASARRAGPRARGKATKK